MRRPHLLAALVAGLWLAVACSTTNSTPSGVTVKTLAQGNVKRLPAGEVFINVLEFRQVPGADFGPHAHGPGLVYTLHGTSTISLPGSAAMSVGPGQAAFLPGLVVHTHENLYGRVGAGAIAVGLILAVIILCAATWLRGGSRRIVIAVLSVTLIGGGALPLIGATTNDWYFIAVRPESQRAQPMPRADGRVAYSAPDILHMPTAPYVETLSAITVPTGARYDAPDVSGPEVIIVVEGSATIHVGDETTQMGGGGATLAQTGQTLTIVNPGSDTLHVIDFAVTSSPAAPA
jgi:mannose-6-phosphate isomerase-like protein (cupin superfamily)